MADKNLKISVKSDLRDGQKLTRFVQDLHQKVEKFAKVLGNLRLGGGPPTPTGQPTPGQQTLAKQLEGDKKAMEGMGREVENLQRRFVNLGNAVQQAGTKMQAASGKGLLVDQFGRPMAPSGAAPGPGGPLPPGGVPPGTPGARPGGGGGINWGAPVGGVLGQVGRFVGWGAIIRNLTQAALGAPQRAIEWASVGAEAGAAGSQSTGRLAARALSNDPFAQLSLMRATGGGKGRNLINQGELEEIITQAPDAARNAAIQKGLGRAVSLDLIGAGQQLRGLTGQARTAEMHKIFARYLENAEQQDVIENTRISYARSQAPGRVAFSRRFGRDFQAGIPAGNAVDPQQTMATVSAVLDVLGTGTALTRVTKLVTEATRKGISNEATQAMLRAQEIGGGDLLGTVLRSGLSRPMMGRAGMGAAGMAAESLLRVRPETFLGGFTALGAGTDELGMRQLEAGRGFLNQVTTGGLDPYQATVNMALATKKGRSVFTTGVLGKMTLTELMQAASKKGPTPEQVAMGITRPVAEQLLNDEINSLGNRAFDESGVDQPPALKRLRAAMGSEGGVIGEARRLRGMGKGGEEGLTELNAALASITGQPLGTRPLDFLLGAQAGAPRGAMAKGTPGALVTALESTMSGTKEMERDWASMKLAMDNLRTATSTTKPFVEGITNALNSLNADELQASMTSLAGLGSAMSEISKKGSAAVDVMEHVQKFVEAVAAKKAAITAAENEAARAQLGP